RSPVRMPLPDALPARSAALCRGGAGMAGTAAPPLGRLPFRQRARPSARGGESVLIPAHEWAARAAPEPEPEPSTRRTEMKASMTTATQLMAAPMTRREWLLLMGAGTAAALVPGGVLAQGKPQRGGVLRVSAFANPSSLDPATGGAGS